MDLSNIILRNSHNFHYVVPFDPVKDNLTLVDLTAANPELTPAIVESTALFGQYIQQQLNVNKSRYAIGGYGEERVIYGRSSLFDVESPGTESAEPRRLHLGIDIWGAAGTPVSAFIGGMIHSFAFNNNFGDYGATIILLHQLEGIPFYSLYGHLSLADIQHISPGQYITYGQRIGRFGEPHENGNWPPHLHFQLIDNMELKEGDYPGVCRVSEKARYLDNCPDPDLVLKLLKYI